MEDAHVSLDSNNKNVIINNLVLSDESVYDFLCNCDNKEEIISKAIVLGISGLKHMSTTGDVYYVKNEFEKLMYKIDEKISAFDLTNTESPLYVLKQLFTSYFDIEKGEIKNLMDKSFNLDIKSSAFSNLIEQIKLNSELKEGAIEDLLDPNAEKSPTKKLKEELIKNIEDLRDKDLKYLLEKLIQIQERMGIKSEIIDHTPLKGFDFENEVYTYLENLAHASGDNIDHVGKETGPTGSAGDIQLDIDGNNKKRIIIECKSTKISTIEVKKEIKSAIQNRCAHYCILVFQNKDYMPREYLPTKITREYIITYMEKENLYLSYRLAKLYLAKETKDSEDINFDGMMKQIIKIVDILNNVIEMKKQASSIINSGTYIRDKIGSLRTDIDACLDEIAKTLGDDFYNKYTQETIEHSKLRKLEKEKNNNNYSPSELPDWTKEV